MDGYDWLCDIAQLDGVRISPFFRVFIIEGSWCVCPTNVAGDPIDIHSIHDSIREALETASRENQRFAAC